MDVAKHTEALSISFARSCSRDNNQVTRACDYVTAGTGAPNVTSYSLTLNSTSLQPCQRDVEVFYTMPEPSPTPDGSRPVSSRVAVRLYRQEMRSAAGDESVLPAAVPARQVYVAEKQATESRGVVKFQCRLFDADYFYDYDVTDDHVTTVGYCFRLVDVSIVGGIMERLERCLALSQVNQGLVSCMILMY